MTDGDRTAWKMRTTGKTYDGTACDNCGTTYEACSRKVFRPDGRACCGACAYSDTHDEREVEQGERLEAHKYRVERMADPTGKHAGCWYFVLDPKHDQHAVAALAAYADAVRAEHPGLAADLDAKVAEHRRPEQAAPAPAPAPEDEWVDDGMAVVQSARINSDRDRVHLEIESGPITVQTSWPAKVARSIGWRLLRAADRVITLYPDRHGQPVERFGADGGRLLPASEPEDRRG